MSVYLVKKDVYFCYAGTQVIFLDLEQNSYSAIDRIQAPSLNGVVAGWQTPGCDAGSFDDAAAGDRMGKHVAESLLKRGILTKSQENGRNATPTQFGKPTTDLLTEYEFSNPSIGLLHVLRFVKSYLYAVFSLRAFSLARIAHRISARRGQVGREVSCKNVSEARELVLIYDHLRPFFFRASEKCLLNSLVLLEFLRHYDVFPTWVIGVTANPFRAHSWLELNRVVVDDFEMHVKNYVPIMTR